jgi:hypothetical protein
MAQPAAIAGLALNLAGVILLFRYGMPYRVETRGTSALLLEGEDKDALKSEAIYRKLGSIGLALIFAGTALQIWPLL